MLDEYFPGEYIGMHLSWLLSESNENAIATDLLSRYFLKLTRGDIDLVADAECGDQARGIREVFVPRKKPCDARESTVLFMLFEQHIDSKNYFDALEVAKNLLISGYGNPRIFCKLANIAGLLFDTSSARSIAKFSMACDIYSENRKALSIFLNHVDDYSPNERHSLKKEISLELLLNPERINNGYHLSKINFPDDDFDLVLDGMLFLDDEVSVQKAAAFLESGFPKKSLEIIEKIIFGGDESDKVLVFYSKILCALDMHEKAVEVIEVARTNGPSELNFRESIRVLNYLGRFDAARKLIEEAGIRRVYLSEAVMIPTFLGLGEIESGYKCYLNVPFRDVVVKYFPTKYATEEIVSFSDMLIMSVYGPGDEIRFASIYPDIAEKAAGDYFKITCDYRLYELFSRSFSDINFVPVRRVRDYSKNNPRHLYNKLPGSDLCSLLDNIGVDAVEEAKSIVMVSDLIWQFRKDYPSFPGRPFLTADPVRVNQFKGMLSSKFPLVGICWRSSLTNHARTEHYLSVEELAPLFAIDGIQFVNLQYDNCDSELAWVESKFPGKLIDISELNQYDDLDGVAALMKNLDLIIAPATSVVELAGALGCSTWLFSNSSELNWRKIDTLGTDVWSRSIKIVEGDRVGNKKLLVESLKLKLIGYFL
jgi:capsular polysaccharide export protein